MVKPNLTIDDTGIDEIAAEWAEFGQANPQAKAEPEEQLFTEAEAEADEPRASPETTNELDVLNKEHSIIDNVAGKTVIASWEPSELDSSKTSIVYHKKGDFLLRYSNRHKKFKVPDPNGGEDKTISMPLGQWWLAQRGRRQYRGVTPAPTSASP
jgi:hypothetical protein